MTFVLQGQATKVEKPTHLSTADNTTSEEIRQALKNSGIKGPLVVSAYEKDGAFLIETYVMRMNGNALIDERRIYSWRHKESTLRPIPINDAFRSEDKPVFWRLFISSAIPSGDYAYKFGLNWEIKPMVLE